MKTTLAILMASTTLASAVTITINQDSSIALDFSIEWGSRISEYGVTATGPSGSTVDWLAQISRNRNYYFVDINALVDPFLQGFGIRFWSDPEYYGPVPTALGSPNISFIGTTLPKITPLDGDPYGARFVFGVPDAGATGWLMALGMVGLCCYGRKI